jgi:hypothetical protein
VVIAGNTVGADEDDSGIAVQVFSGEAIAPGQPPAQSLVVFASGGRWSAPFASLAPGAYVARAVQVDSAGNEGVSNAITFFITPQAAAAAGKPLASFSWYPAIPHAGERVSLVSSSTDTTSRLSGFEWDLAGSNAFQAGAQVMSTVFASAGNHVVRLRVADISGASAVATQTIPVSGRAAALMQPFPLVRIVTTHSGSGTKLRVLSILAARGARITITCKGSSCPVRRESKIASSGKVGLASVSFSRFERVLSAGTVIEIRVSKRGQVGKYTRLSIRRDGSIGRLDKCLAPDGKKPIACPAP